MRFEEEYQELFQFLACWFPETDFEGKTDEQATSDYIRVSPLKRLKTVAEEISAAKIRLVFVWKDIADAANRYFLEPNEVLLWLVERENQILREMNSE